MPQIVTMYLPHSPSLFLSFLTWVSRAVVEAAGIKDIRTKALRSNNPCNVVSATMEGLARLRTAEQAAATRGKTAKEILG